MSDHLTFELPYPMPGEDPSDFLRRLMPRLISTFQQIFDQNQGVFYDDQGRIILNGDGVTLYDLTISGLGTMASQNATSVAITGGDISGITDLAVLDGGTGASTATGARTNLGLGSMSVQAASSVAITGGSGVFDTLETTGDTITIQTTKTPATASDTGTTGQIAWDSSYIYVCTATDTWVRAALATW